MPAGSASTSLSITNPLVLYRTLVATRKIRPDPAQHRLAIQLQKLYYRLKDYSPQLEYRYRLDQISRTAASDQNVSQQRQSEETISPAQWSERVSAWFKPLPSSILALTRTTPMLDSAISTDSPHGMLLYGEVGRGKSMLLDMLYTSLPSEKKRRWHFNTFMLDIFRRLEQIRIERSRLVHVEHEHMVLALAKDTISTSPILFLDEFQMPDRVSSKILNTFMTAFFHLGGVLIASSNRMPEELAKASGIDFSGSRRQSRAGLFGWGLSRSSEGQKAAENDFAQFVEVLKARCEVWEMEGEKDWRREAESDADEKEIAQVLEDSVQNITATTKPMANASMTGERDDDLPLSSDSPRHYYVNLTDSTPTSEEDARVQFSKDIDSLNPTGVWKPTILTVYSRQIQIPKTYAGVAVCDFDLLCASYLGPADYVSLCSTFHTLVVTKIPVLTINLKNEARRFITLLDALYESRCRLIVNADAPPDRLFFPDQSTRERSKSLPGSTTGPTSERPGHVSSKTDLKDAYENQHDSESESIASESYSEVYLDTTNPFRPNVSSYVTPKDSLFPTNLFSNIRTGANPNTNPTRSVLADEDADFGPTYGNGRSPATMSTFSPLSPVLPNTGPDFTDTSTLTGTDERFAYKRARSRLWEMCGRKWWRDRPISTTDTALAGDMAQSLEPPPWWTPVPVGKAGRFWETQSIGSAGSSVMQTVVAAAAAATASTPSSGPTAVDPVDGIPHTATSNTSSGPTAEPHIPQGKGLEGTSPFRVYPDPPPRFGWQHAWGMIKWGKKAGEWGKGVEGDRFAQNKDKVEDYNVKRENIDADDQKRSATNQKS